MGKLSPGKLKRENTDVKDDCQEAVEETVEDVTENAIEV